MPDLFKKLIIFIGLSFTYLAWDAGAGSGWADEFFWQEGDRRRIAELDSAEKILGKDRFGKFQNFLRQKECRQAMSLLNKGFVEYYPQYVHAAEPDGRSYFNWVAHAVRVISPALELCSSKEQLAKLEASLAGKPSPIGTYRLGSRTGQKEPEGYFGDWQFRDLIISSIFRLAEDGYHPALPVLAKLYERGDVFEAGPEPEYYLLKRACHFNVDCEGLKPRIAELEKLIPEDMQVYLTVRGRIEELDLKLLDQELIFNQQTK